MTYKKLYYFYFLTVVILLIPLSFLGQSRLFLNDYAFSCTRIDCSDENFKSLGKACLFELKTDGNQFYLKNSNFDRPLETQLRELYNYLGKKTITITPLIFTGYYNKEILIQLLQKIFNGDLFIKQDRWPTESYLKENHKSIIAVFNDEIITVSKNLVDNKREYLKKFSSESFDKLVVFKINESNSDSLFQECIQFWQTTGKVPNLLIVEPSQITIADSIAKLLNQTLRFKGEVKHNNQYLNEIYWKQTPGAITPGKFSFPSTSNNILSPYKNGYRIIPGEIISNLGTIDEPRIFDAYTSSIEDQLIMDFNFDFKIENRCEPNWSDIIVKNVSFIKDSIKGRVVLFDKNNSFIDYTKENSLNFDSPISVAAWIRPDTITRYMGIVGFGSSFSLKLNRGNIDFTTARIKDHYIEKPLEAKKWHHVAIVFNPNSVVDFFINGEKSGSVFASEIIPSRQPLVIGNNVWGEQFYGAIDDLKIWNRGLSENEIKRLYLTQEKQSILSNTWGNPLFYIILISIIGSALIIIRRRRHSAKQVSKTKKSKSGTDENKQDQIRLFGTFYVYSKKEGDITTSFSPLIRQILSFFILQSEEDNNGISIKKLTDTFWPGYQKDKAKENRGTNIKKLKKLLNDIRGVNVSYQNKKWFFETTGETTIDFLEFRSLKDQLEKKLQTSLVDEVIIDTFLNLLERGNILQNSDAEWLDSFKNKISGQVINLLLEIYQTQKKTLKTHHNIKLAKIMLLFDNINEEALRILISELSSIGNHGRAKQAYDEFSKNYALLYGEEFPRIYSSFINN